MSDDTDDADVFVALAVASTPVSAGKDARARLMAAIQTNPYLPFLGQLSSTFDLPESSMRELLARIDDPSFWVLGVPPIQGHLNFRPGSGCSPLRGGLARMQAGTRLPTHRHTDREVTTVLQGALVDGDGRHYGPGDRIDMPAGSVHSLAVPSGTETVVALLHGRIEMLGG